MRPAARRTSMYGKTQTMHTTTRPPRTHWGGVSVPMGRSSASCAMQATLGPHIASSPSLLGCKNAQTLRSYLTRGRYLSSARTGVLSCHRHHSIPRARGGLSGPPHMQSILSVLCCPPTFIAVATGRADVETVLACPTRGTHAPACAPAVGCAGVRREGRCERRPAWLRDRTSCAMGAWGRGLPGFDEPHLASTRAEVRQRNLHRAPFLAVIDSRWAGVLDVQHTNSQRHLLRRQLRARPASLTASRRVVRPASTTCLPRCPPFRAA